MMGREPVHLEYIAGEALRQPASVAVSHRAESLEEVSLMVERTAAGAGIPVPNELVERRSRVIADFFWANDGQAAVRVAHAVLLAAEAGEGPGRRGAGGYRLRLLRAARGWRSRLQQAVLLLLGGRLHDRIRRLVRPMPLAGAKRFGAPEVKAILLRLTKVETRFALLAAREGRGTDCVVSVPGGLRAVRVASRETR